MQTRGRSPVRASCRLSSTVGITVAFRGLGRVDSALVFPDGVGGGRLGRRGVQVIALPRPPLPAARLVPLLFFQLIILPLPVERTGELFRDAGQGDAPVG